MLITINDKQVKLRFGMHVAEFMGDLFEDGVGSIEKSARLIMLAHENHCKAVVGEVVQVTQQELFTAIEDATIGQNQDVVNTVAAVWKAFSNSPLVSSLLAKVDEVVKEAEAPKKKAPGKK